ncbi:MAG TPA: hypothetical protein VKA54_13420 [Gemmatimonadaceae bacterium]|nr:hypothetical protein [Gemmatimonadaceae bacterium]
MSSKQPISRSSAEHYHWGGACDGRHLLRDAHLSVIEERMPPATREERHRVVSAPPSHGDRLTGDNGMRQAR